MSKLLRRVLGAIGAWLSDDRTDEQVVRDLKEMEKRYKL